MICLQSTCQRDIPDDSVFCDQCGSPVLVCPTCGQVKKGKFCGACGKALVPRTPRSGTPGSAPRAQAVTNSTIRSSLPPLRLCHSGGQVLVVTGELVLGRDVGAWTEVLGKCPLVSGQHGRILFKEGQWCYRDVGSDNRGSTNGSKVSGVVCVPNRDIPLKNGDVLILADQEIRVACP